MTYWRATVERPDGNGGWVTVGVFGTADTPGSGASRHIHGDTALDAARLVLSHVWPVNLDDFLKSEGEPGRWRARDAAKTDIADHRITLDVDPARLWSAAASQPEPVTVTVAELRLAEIRDGVAGLAAAKARLDALNDEVRRARADVRHLAYRVEEAVDEATRAGVPEPAVRKARRQPRRTRKSSG